MRLVMMLNELPVLVPDAHTRPFRNAHWNMAAGIVFPVGMFFFFRIWRYRVRLRRDMAVIQEQCGNIVVRIGKIEEMKN